MINNVNYSYCRNELVLVQAYDDILLAEDLIKSWDILMESQMISKDILGVVSDYRSCDFQIDVADFESIYLFIRSNIHAILNLKFALVLDSPKVAIIQLFIKRYHLDSIQVFCSMEAAMDWIDEGSRSI